MKRRIEGLSRKEDYAEVVKAELGTLFFKAEKGIPRADTNTNGPCAKKIEAYAQKSRINSNKVYITFHIFDYIPYELEEIFSKSCQKLKDRNGKECTVYIYDHTITYMYPASERITVKDIEHDTIKMLNQLVNLVEYYERNKSICSEEIETDLDGLL